MGRPPMRDHEPVRTWMLHSPKPALVRAHLQDDDYRDVPCKGPWSRVAATIEALEPVMLEAYDEKGVLIRARKMIAPAAKVDDSAPDVPPPLTSDPETARLTHFANLLYRAHVHSKDVAFDKLLDLVDRLDARSARQDERLERLENAYRRMLRDQLAREEEAAAELLEKAAEAQEEASGGGMGAAFVQSMLAGQAAQNNPNGRQQ